MLRVVPLRCVTSTATTASDAWTAPAAHITAVTRLAAAPTCRPLRAPCAASGHRIDSRTFSLRAAAAGVSGGYLRCAAPHLLPPHHCLRQYPASALAAASCSATHCPCATQWALTGTQSRQPSRSCPLAVRSIHSGHPAARMDAHPADMHLEQTPSSTQPSAVTAADVTGPAGAMTGDGPPSSAAAVGGLGADHTHNPTSSSEGGLAVASPTVKRRKERPRKTAGAAPPERQQLLGMLETAAGSSDASAGLAAAADAPGGAGAAGAAADALMAAELQLAEMRHARANRKKGGTGVTSTGDTPGDPPPKRGRTKRSKQAAGDGDAGVEDATLAAEGGAMQSLVVAAGSVEPAAAADAVPKKRRRGGTKAAAAAADAVTAANPAAAEAGQQEVAADDATGAAAKPPAGKRPRKRSKSAAAAAGDGTAGDAEAGGDPVKPVKPKKLTKKDIMAIVQAEARQGVFQGLTSLADKYSHVGLFTGAHVSTSWQQLLEAAQQGKLGPLAAPAAGAAAAAAGGDVGGPGSTQPEQRQLWQPAEVSAGAGVSPGGGAGVSSDPAAAAAGPALSSPLRHLPEDTHHCSTADGNLLRPTAAQQQPPEVALVALQGAGLSPASLVTGGDARGVKGESPEAGPSSGSTKTKSRMSDRGKAGKAAPTPASAAATHNQPQTGDQEAGQLEVALQQQQQDGELQGVVLDPADLADPAGKALLSVLGLQQAARIRRMHSSQLQGQASQPLGDTGGGSLNPAGTDGGPGASIAVAAGGAGRVPSRSMSQREVDLVLQQASQGPLPQQLLLMRHPSQQKREVPAEAGGGEEEGAQAGMAAVKTEVPSSSTQLETAAATSSQPDAAAGTAVTGGGDAGDAVGDSGVAQEMAVLPNLGYACLNMTMREYDIFNSRDCVKKTFESKAGLETVSKLALANARDLVPLIRWNEAHGIRLFRLSSCIFPWMTFYHMEDLPDWTDIQAALREAGDLAKSLGHRLTFHPSEFCKIAGEREDWTTQSVLELEVHSKIFDEMGFLPATPFNKINIHVGGVYGDKAATMERFSKVVNERLSPNCKARLTVENDDRASMYSVQDLMTVHRATGIPIVFDFHHHKFCPGTLSHKEALELALTTWPPGVRPIVHWSESPEDKTKKLHAHSDFIVGPVDLHGYEGQVDVMIESKAKELALLQYRQQVLLGLTPDQRTGGSLTGGGGAAAAGDGGEGGAGEDGEGVVKVEGGSQAYAAGWETGSKGRKRVGKRSAAAAAGKPKRGAKGGRGRGDDSDTEVTEEDVVEEEGTGSEEGGGDVGAVAKNTARGRAKRAAARAGQIASGSLVEGGGVVGGHGEAGGQAAAAVQGPGGEGQQELQVVASGKKRRGAKKQKAGAAS